MKKCPYCAEDIQNWAKKCRFCWEWIEENVKSDLSTNEEDIYASMKKIYSDPDNIDITNGDYVPPRLNNDETLLEIILYEDIETIEKTIKWWADVNTRDKYGITILMSAFCNPHIDFNGIKKLIELWANINARSNDGRTMFMFACYSRPTDEPSRNSTYYDSRIKFPRYNYKESIKCCTDKIAILELLIQNWEDINAKDHFWKTALSYAIEEGRRTLAKFLQKIGGRDSRSIFTKFFM